MKDGIQIVFVSIWCLKHWTLRFMPVKPQRTEVVSEGFCRLKCSFSSPQFRQLDNSYFCLCTLSALILRVSQEYYINLLGVTAIFTYFHFQYILLYKLTGGLS